MNNFIESKVLEFYNPHKEIYDICLKHMMQFTKYNSCIRQLRSYNIYYTFPSGKKKRHFSKYSILEHT